MLTEDPDYFNDLSLRLTVSGRSSASARSILETLSSVSGFHNIFIEGSLDEQDKIELKSRFEEVWTAKEIRKLADSILQRAKVKYDSGCYLGALGILRPGRTCQRYIRTLWHHHRLVEEVDLELSIARMQKDIEVAIIIAAFKAKQYAMVCLYYEISEWARMPELSNVERGKVSCCAALASTGKQLQMINGPETLTLETALESTDDDESLKELVHWLNDEIWTEELLIQHPSHDEYSKIRDGYNIWLSIEEDETAS